MPHPVQLHRSRAADRLAAAGGRARRQELCADGRGPGAVAALVVSLAQALLGILALGVAFLVALGPIIAVLGIVLIKIKDIVSAQQQLKTDALNLKSAYDSQKQAVTQLQQAEVNESRARIQALQAQRQAVLALTDAENATALWKKSEEMVGEAFA